jgi:multiple sugar transport system permease protein
LSACLRATRATSGSLQATFYYAFVAIPLRLIFALAVAMLLNTNRRMVGGYRAAYYAPSIVGGSVAVAVMWREIFGTDGLINAVLAHTLRGWATPVRRSGR